MTFPRIILGLAVTAALLLLQLLCGYGAALLCNPGEQPWLCSWQDVCAAPARAAEAVQAAMELEYEPEPDDALRVEIELQGDRPVTKVHGQELPQAELLDFFTRHNYGTDARPVLFTTQEELTEQQWDSVLTPCLTKLDFFWNYSVDAPEPKQEEKTPAAPQKQRVYIDISGFNGDTIIYCGSERIDEADFPAFIEELAARDPRPQICLNGQCSLPWERMRELVEICIGKGFDNADVVISMQCGPEPQNR